MKDQFRSGVGSVLLVFMLMFILILLLGSLSFITYSQRPEGFLVVSLRSDLITMNPFLQSLTDESAVSQLVYETLYRQALNGSFVPWLAYRVEVLDNGTLWKFYIRDGVKWHDGVPLTAEDVEFTFNYTVKYKFPLRVNIWDPIERVWRENNIVYVKLKYPYAAFPVALTSLYIIPKHIWENITDPMTFSNFANPIGSGPFIWVERKAGDYIVLRANENYWAGAPKIKGVIFKVYGSADAAYIATVNREIDAMNILFISPDLLPRASEDSSRDPSLKIHLREPPYFQYLTFSLTRYPFSVKEFREAMLYAMNVSEIVEVVYKGLAKPGSLGTIAPVFNDMPEKYYRPGLEKENLYPFNLTKANEILDKLNFKRGSDGVRVTPNGTRLEFQLIVSSIYPDRVRIAEMIRDWFAQIGVKINVQVLDHRTVATKLLNRDFDMCLIGMWFTSDPDGWFNLLHSSSAVKGGFNTADYKNPVVDALLETQRRTINVTERREIVWKLQETVAKDIPYIPLVHIIEPYAYRTDRFTGWQLSKIFAPVNFWTLTSLEPVSATKPTTASLTTQTQQTQTTTATSSPKTTASTSATTPATQSAASLDTGYLAALAVVVLIIVALIFFVFIRLRRR
ncbi:MAG: peptide ABC transporter substrate-binding protein [Sulfolobales archaeon]